jgi:hypothetical protein
MPTKKKEPFTVDENIDVSIVELSPTQGFKISLVSKNNERYISVTRVYKTKTDNKWKPKSGMWIPYAAANDIIPKLYLAYETGTRLGWDKKKTADPEDCLIDWSDLWH